MEEQESGFIKNNTCQKDNFYRVKLIIKVSNIVLFVIFTAILLLYEFDYLKKHKTGFYCNDSSITFPYNGETISKLVLIIIILIVPLICLILLELITAKNISWLSFKNTHLSTILSVYGEYFLGLYCVLFITKTAKLTLSEPRPHFIDTCRPNINCTNNGTLYYVSEYICTGPGSERRILSASESFPSGHASMSVYFGCFMIWYIQKRLCNIGLLVLPSFLQCIVVSISGFISISRIYDHRHHWWDVVFGGLIAVIFFIYQIPKYSSKLYSAEIKVFRKTQIQEMTILE